ncbi:MAG: DUF4445 domain-containing protein [Clostridia bacterium]|nr:DUF4445 domain-containing protein [Clostridia bacterium]
MNEQIKVIVNGETTLALAGMLLSEIIKAEKPCGGHGRYGKCKVRASGIISSPTDDEKKLLSERELADGIRLACLTYAIGDCEIETLGAVRPEQIVADMELPKLELKPAFKKYGIAVDIGTTTLAARLYGANGTAIGDVSCINPQREWGADVITRVEASLNGKGRELANAIRGAVNDIIRELCSRDNINPMDIDGAVITGNTVMLSLLTEQSVEPFSHAPFNAERLFGETLTASTLGISILASATSIYLPPCISAFVGADTTCALLATELCKKDTAMLADIGTNGEMAIWHGGKLTVCSTAAGPAFEGVGISMGMRGAYGAIDRVCIQNGQPYAHVIGDTDPIGICGSGLVDAVACMLDLEIIDSSGYLDENEFMIKAPVSLTQEDIRMLQLAKSAICAGLMTLADSVHLGASDVDALFVAGGFGSYLNKRSATRIGLLPQKLAENSRAVGNAALSGACMLLLNTDLRERAERLADGASTLELSTNSVFADLYVSGMMLEKV